jgi:hypothetical protein
MVLREIMSAHVLVANSNNSEESAFAARSCKSAHIYFAVPVSLSTYSNLKITELIVMRFHI